MNQQCVNTSSCGPQSCAGCCANGLCYPGGDTTACGTGGSACQLCVGFCFGGTCLSFLPGNGGGDGGTGAPCTSSSHCENFGFLESSRCIPERRSDGGLTGWVSGYCSSTCLLGYCPGNGTCLSDNNCYTPCSTPNQGRGSCRVGYVCLQLYRSDGGISTGNGVCQPDCRNAGVSCNAGYTCNALGHCI